jgi:acetyl-CoA carboxylase biotin carboxyl carrier protein
MARISKTPIKPASKPVKTPTSSNITTAKIVAKNLPGDSGGDFQEVRTLIELLKKNDLAVLEFAKGDFKITLKTSAGAAGATMIQGAPSIAAPSVAPLVTEKTPAAEPVKKIYQEIKSPMVGTFYASVAPESPSFVEVGTTITHESVVCIIEAMKVMNEIKAEISGKVVEIVAENGKPVQFGEVLFRVS